MSFQKVPDFRKFLDHIPKSVEKTGVFGFGLSHAFYLYARNIDAGWRKCGMKDKGESISLFLLQKIGAGWVKTSELQIMNNYLELGVRRNGTEYMRCICGWKC